MGLTSKVANQLATPTPKWLAHNKAGTKHGERPRRRAIRNPTGPEEARGRARRDQQHSAQIKKQWKAPPNSVHDAPFGDNRTFIAAFQQSTATIDEVIADMRCPIFGALCGRGLGVLDRLAGHVVLRPAAPLGDLLDGMAVTVASGEVHFGVEMRRILAQRLLDQAMLFDKFTPIVRAEKPEAGDAVAHRNLVGGLRLTFGRDQPFGRQPLFRQPVFEPTVGESEMRAVSL